MEAEELSIGDVLSEVARVARVAGLALQIGVSVSRFREQVSLQKPIFKTDEDAQERKTVYGMVHRELIVGWKELR